MLNFQTIETALREAPNFSKGRITETYEGSDTLTLFFLKGAPSEKVIWLQAALHGDEYDGIYASMELFSEIDLHQLTGVLLFVPIVNKAAFQNETNAAPIDGINLNRVFSDAQQESFSKKYGYWLAGKILKHASFFIDLHGGGRYLEVLPFAMINAAIKESISAKIMTDLNVDAIYLVGGQHESMLLAYLARQGLGGILLESGGGIHHQQTTIETHKLNVYQLLNILDIYAYTNIDSYITKRSNPIIIKKVRDYYFPEEGLLLTYQPAGKVIQKGEVLFEYIETRDFTRRQLLYEEERGKILSIHNAVKIKEHGYAAMISELL